MLEFKYDTQLLIEGEDLDEDVFYHGTDTTAEFLKFRVSSYLHHRVKISVRYFFQIAQKDIDPIHDFAFYQIIHQNNDHYFYQKQIEEHRKNTPKKPPVHDIPWDGDP